MAEKNDPEVDPQAKFETRKTRAKKWEVVFNPGSIIFFLPQAVFRKSENSKIPPKPETPSKPKQQPKQQTRTTFSRGDFCFEFFFLVLHNNKKLTRNNSAARLGVAGQGLMSWILPGVPLFLVSAVRFVLDRKFKFAQFKIMVSHTT